MDLKNKKIVITRRFEDSQSLIKGINSLGGIVILCPAIRIENLPGEVLRRKIGSVSKFDWIVFTSRNAVKSIEVILNNNDKKEESSFKGKIAVIGEKTAEEIEKLGFKIDFMASKSTGESLKSELLSCVKEDEKVLLPESQIAGKTVAEGLKEKGISVLEVTTYKTLPGRKEDARELINHIEGGIVGTPDAVLFASPSAVRGTREMVGRKYFEQLMEHGAIFSIGPATTREIKSSGFSKLTEADPHNSDGLLNALSFFSKEIKS